MTDGAMAATRSWWGWGLTSKALGDADCAGLAARLPGLPDAPLPVPDLAALELPEPRISPPGSLAEVVSSGRADRAAHTYGKAYRDVVRALRGDLTPAPDLVAFPREESDVVDLLDWAGDHEVAVIPYGGGSSVVGGVEYRGARHAAVLSLDLSRMNRVIEVDAISRAARVQAGAFGPALEAQLRPHGYMLRHFPQSFEFSTLGGWLATRAGGHYATGHTHIDDFVESIRAVTPIGISESWRLPGSGAGPSPDRQLLGSEGILGVITEAWMRVQDRPVHKASAAVRFDEFARGVEAVRLIAQSGLNPTNCRLLDPGEAGLYFTVIASGRRGSELAQWDEIKVAAMEVLGRNRASITHHHAVGRDHRPGYDRQRPEPFAVALRAAKDALDPRGVLNPGVLID